jgi:hypothetical protein
MIENFKDKRISIILKLELELTEAILNGHKAKDNDKFAKTRSKLKKLRDELGIKEYRQRTNNS